MDIHKPKPVHSLREFLSELGTIVMGILIALALEEGLRTLHDRATAREARDAVYAEIRENLGYLQGRAATLSCVERRLDEVGGLLERAGTGTLSPRPQWIGQPAIYFMVGQRWSVASGSGRASLFAPDEQGRLAGLYVIFDQVREAQRQEQDAWSQLRGLESWTGPLGPAGRVHFSEALQEARYQLWSWRVLTGLAALRARALGVDPPSARAMAKGVAIPHAVCLPIDTPRAEALERLGHGPGANPWGQPQ